MGCAKRPKSSPGPPPLTSHLSGSGGGGAEAEAMAENAAVRVSPRRRAGVEKRRTGAVRCASSWSDCEECTPGRIWADSGVLAGVLARRCPVWEGARPRVGCSGYMLTGGRG
eukprot:1181694-Prorocentrum_minimum.AAC.3